jgi:signal transduction histidine kinase
VVAGRLGLVLADFQRNATLIWAPTGLSLAVLVLFGWRVWPGVLLGAAITNAMILSTPPAAVAAIAIGNTLEAVVGATLLERLARFDSAFARLRDVVAFLIYGVLLSTLVSATIGVGALHLSGAIAAHDFGAVWLIWWLGDAGGAVVVAPLLLVGIRGRPPWAAIARRVETWFVAALLVGLLNFAFVGPIPEPTHALLPALLVFPVLVWAGLRLGPRGAIVGSFVAGVVAVVGTVRGLGPFAIVGLTERLYLVWAYVSAMGAVTMILAAAVAERELAELAKQQGEERVRDCNQTQHTRRLESLGLLAGGVAHDFNNLLVVIRSNAELLRRVPHHDLVQRSAMLDEIEAASVQATNLCRQLLTYAGHNRVDKQRLDLQAIIADTLPLVRSSTPPSIALELVGGDVQAIEGDDTQVRQLLMNLVINAIESIGDRGGWVRVSSCTRELSQRYLDETFLHSDAPAGRYAVLEVADNGSGMTPEAMAHIFDPFFTTKKAGRGLGMAMVLSTVNAHEGAIKVRSQPGEGTTFEVLFPVALELQRPAARDEPSAPSLRGGTVLLADDEERVRRTTRLLLESAGFEVLEAQDGSEAIEVFEANADGLDVVVLDVSMPGLDGTDALVKIRELRPEVPAVLMSGYDEARVEPQSGTAFVQKPFKLQVLLDTIATAMQHKE